MHYTYMCEFIGSVEVMEFPQSLYNLLVHINTVAEVPQDNKSKYTLHHTAALSLSLFLHSLFLFS